MIEIGQTFGRLTVLTVDADRKGRFICRCVCGVEKSFAKHNLKGKRPTRSCGCLKIETAGKHSITHGGSDSPEFAIWSGMKARCYNPRVKAYKYYGGRGIKVCDRWKESFSNFLSDMGPRPSPAHSIERDNANKDYAPDNCHWATREEQNNNKTSSVKITHEGQTKTAAQWAEMLGLDRYMIYRRINRGWPLNLVLAPTGSRLDRLQSR